MKISQKDYVNYKQAKALKELGFDWVCDYYYDKDGKMKPICLSIFSQINNFISNNFLKKNKENKKDIAYAPSLYQAQKWIREKNLFIYIMCNDNRSDSFYYMVCTKLENCLGDLNNKYDSYEEAFSEGISVALNVLKNERM